MLLHRINVLNAVKYPRGSTLVELLVVVSLSTFLITLFFHFAVDLYFNQQKQRERLSLQQHSQHIMRIFQQHIPHMGYLGADRAQSNYALFLNSQKQAYHIENESCLIFFYDLNQDGCIGKRKNLCQLAGRNNTKGLTDEVFGFKYHQQQILALALNESTMANCTATQCRQLLKHCPSSSHWDKFTEGLGFSVKLLTFKLVQANLMKVELVLISNRDKQISYQSHAYIALLNTETE